MKNSSSKSFTIFQIVSQNKCEIYLFNRCEALKISLRVKYAIFRSLILLQQTKKFK